MKADCHIHMVLDGENWRGAIRRHEDGPDEDWIRGILSRYREQGYTYLRDGGDRWNAGKWARHLAPEYGIVYRTPLAPLHKKGHYGGFIGQSWDNLKQFRESVEKMRELGADFIKIMISGLMDFDRFGVLTEEGLSESEIRETIHIAHEEGFSVMAHANGARCVEAAARAGVDSVEHGAYLDEAALAAMKESGTVWVPTVSTIGNLRGKGRFEEKAVQKIFQSAAENIRCFAAMGGLIAPGSDAGAWAVPHGCGTEYDLMEEILGRESGKILESGVENLRRKF